MLAHQSKNYIMRYVIYTYGLFGVLILSFGAIAVKLFDGTPLVMRWLTTITAWTSTYVFLFMFKKLYPNSTVKSFYKKAFAAPLNFSLLIATTIIQVLIFAAGVFMVSIQRGVMTLSLLDFSLPIITSALFFALIQGATGEESGWRGYLLPAIVEKIGVVKGSLVVGLVWSLWHAPIWFLGTGYRGAALVTYIVAFVICLTSLGFVIGICYFHCKNLLVPIWIHFLFNLFGETYRGSMVDLVVWYAVFYFLLAVGFYAWHKHAHVRSKEIIVTGKLTSRGSRL